MTRTTTTSKTTPAPPTDRRNFLRTAGIAGAAGARSPARRTASSALAPISAGPGADCSRLPSAAGKMVAIEMGYG